MKTHLIIIVLFVAIGLVSCDGGEGSSSSDEMDFSQWSLIYTSYENNASQINKIALDSFHTINLSDTIFSPQSSGDYFFPDGDFQADVAPDGNKIVFASNKRTGSTLFFRALNDGNIISLEIGPLKATNPVWSPASRLVAFEAGAQFFSSHKKIYLLDIEGTAFESPMQITFPEVGHSDNGGIAFLEDGKKIIFSRQNSENSIKDLYLKDVFKPDSLAIALTNTPDVSEYFPVISSDYSLLAFHSYNPGASIRKIKVTTVDNIDTIIHEIELNVHHAINPGKMDFAPDNSGLFLSFDRDEEGITGMGGYELYFISMDGSELIQLTDNNFPDTDPNVLNVGN